MQKGPEKGELESHICLFNAEAYHRANMDAEHSFVRVDHRERGRLVGAAAGVFDGATLECGWHAPFGGLDLVRSAERATAISGLVQGFIEAAERLGASKLRVRCPPLNYPKQESLIQYVLMSQGFAVETVDLTLGVELRGVGSPAEYMKRLGATARTVVRHGMAAGLQWKAADGEAGWKAGHDILAATKSRLGATILYTAHYLQALAERFPGRIRMNLMSQGPRVVAAALVYRVLPEVDYLAAWGQSEHALPFSPMNLVAYRLVEDSLADRMSLLDLGISSAEGSANDGLVQFKRHIGGLPALKLNLVREL